ncbi:radical SAM protein, partial [Micromonospora sp. NPDC051296]
MPGSDDRHRPAGGTATRRAPPVAFRQFVLKLHSRCDLACAHCYVYTMADQGWRDLPRTMSPSVLDAAARRIGEHARTHRLDLVSVILHGGEPLLAGPARVESAVSAIRHGAAPVPARVTVQT